MRAAIDAFLDTPKVKSTPNTLRAYTNVLDRTAEQVGVMPRDPRDRHVWPRRARNIRITLGKAA
jgi:hypothetical protein